MNKLEMSKKVYEEIEIPERLNEMVASTIQEHGRKTKGRSRKMPSVYKAVLGAAAGFVVVIFVGVNTNTAFAKELSGIPVVGKIVKLITISSYQKKDEDKYISVEIPAIESIKQDTKGLSKAVNQEIYDMCTGYAKEAEQRAEEYKTAFLETGGTLEEWKEHDIQIKVWYEIKNQSEKYLSFAVNGTENWTSAYAQSKYYNLDLENLQYLTLKDLLGENYISIANSSIKKQIKEREEERGEMFFTAEEGGFETISEETKFYINDAENPVIVFDKYEIAPGNMGAVEFEL